jgi:hypothetical protein
MLYIPTSDEDTDEHDINADDIRIPSGPCLSVCVSPAAKTFVVVTGRAWLVRCIPHFLLLSRRADSSFNWSVMLFHC